MSLGILFDGKQKFRSNKSASSVVSIEWEPNDLNWYTADADTNTRTHIHHSFYEQEDTLNRKITVFQFIKFHSIHWLNSQSSYMCFSMLSIPFFHTTRQCYMPSVLMTVQRIGGLVDLNDVIIESMMSFECRRMNVYTIMTYNAWNFQWKCHLDRINVACALEQCTAWPTKPWWWTQWGQTRFAIGY